MLSHAHQLVSEAQALTRMCHAVSSPHHGDQCLVPAAYRGGRGGISVLPEDLAAIGKTAGVVETHSVDLEWMDHGTWSPDGQTLACNQYTRVGRFHDAFAGTALVTSAPCSENQFSHANWNRYNTFTTHARGSHHVGARCTNAAQQARDMGGHCATGEGVL